MQLTGNESVCIHHHACLCKFTCTVESKSLIKMLLFSKVYKFAKKKSSNAKCLNANFSNNLSESKICFGKFIQFGTSPFRFNDSLHMSWHGV